VQVGEQGQPLPHPVVLLGHGLLDLQHHVHAAVGAPCLLGAVDDARAGTDVLLIGDLRPQPRLALDHHLVPVRDQLVDPDRGDRHPVLVVLDFLRYADSHDRDDIPEVAPRNVAATTAG
jgi:hypothetical protein